MNYLLKDKENKQYVEFEELNTKRKEYLKKQEENGNNPILFCNCCSNPIPMILTKHEPTPHLQTKFSADKVKHYKFCKHFIDEGNRSAYKPAIIVNEEGIEIAHVNWKENEELLESKIDREYKRNNSFQYNNCDKVIQGKMTFDAFIKYKNMQYFKIYQCKYTCFKLDEFNKKLFGWIENSYIGKAKVKELDKGKFFYGIVDEFDNKYKNRCIIKIGKLNVFCKTDVLNKAIQKFKNTYNNLDINGIFGNDECRLICYGFIDTTLKYPICKTIGFILVNKYGLFCESLNEVRMFNLICDNLFEKCLNEKYLFYKPTEPENDYSNPNFISDGVIKKKGIKEKIVVEIFGRNEDDYIRRKTEKMSTCKSDGIFWDVFDSKSWHECEDKLKRIFIS